MKKILFNSILLLCLTFSLTSAQSSSEYPHLRIKGDFSRMRATPGVNASFFDYIENVLFPPVKSYLEKTFRVKYPVTTQIKVPESFTNCGDNLPQSLIDGVDNADIVILFDIMHDDWEDGYLTSAMSGSCYLEQNYKKRPLVATSSYNPLSFVVVDPAETPVTHEQQTVTMIHELLHALGFAPGNFPDFVRPNGTAYGVGILGTYYLGAASFPYVNAEPVKSKVREFFNCSTLPGAILENTGNGHWEKQFFAYEAMATGGGAADARLSELTLAFMETTGWYIANYSMADPYFYGKGRGCSFIFYSQATANNAYNKEEHCNTLESYGCGTEGLGAGRCRNNTYTGVYSNFYSESNGFHCHVTAEQSDEVLFANSLQSRGRFSQSRCFNGNIYESGYFGGDYNYCFQYRCLNDNTLLQVKIGTEYFNCTEKSTVSVPVNNAGDKLYCPDPVKFCTTKGQKYCPRGCMGRGECIEGTCQCYAGFAGLDCGYDA